ncbi:MAG: extracellular solute-binding protein, partial [Anaerolineae bacterium]|nr:extracellular solute-binding protein [Anaerolineae bacterium]
EPYLAASKAITQDTFLKPSWDLVTWKGKVYGIPGLEHFMVMGQLASVDLYEQAGLKVPDDLPVTMSDVMAQVKQYTKRNEAGDISKENWYWWELVLGVHAYTAETAVYNFKDPLWIEALRWAGEFYKMLGPDKVEAFHSAYSQWTAVAGNAWATGTQAWQSQSGYWEVGETAKTAPDRRFYWYWNPVWEHRRGTRCQELGGHALCIPKAAKHPEQAWRLSEYLVSLEALRIIFDGCGFLTATKEFLEDPGKVVDFYKYPGLRFWVDSPKEADELWAEPRGPIDGFVWDKFPKAIDSVILGQATPEEAATELQRLVDEEFATVTKQ